jgi:mRNA interferase HigB
MAWNNTLRRASCKAPAELRVTFASADLVGEFTVFNVGGNKFRLVAFIDYRVQIVYIKHVLTHKEYAERKWKQ